MKNRTSVKDHITKRVIDYYIANPPSIEQITHTQTVASYTRLIAVGEGMDEDAVNLHEFAAWLHDVEELTSEEKQWLADVVGTHHQLKYAQSLHFEPLFEADLIVNLIEGYYSMGKATDFYEKMMTTVAGRDLFSRLFL